MASTKNEQAVQWAAAASKSVTAGATETSDAITLNVEDWAGTLTVNADNNGTAATGDKVNVYIAWSNGDTLGDTGDDYDTTEHAQFVGQLNTYGTDTPGEDPARRTWDIDVAGKTSCKVICVSQAGTNAITVRATLTTHRPQ